MAIDIFLTWHVFFVLLSIVAVLTALWPKLDRWGINPANVLMTGFGASVLLLIVAEIAGVNLNYQAPLEIFTAAYAEAVGMTLFIAFLAAFVPFLLWITKPDENSKITSRLPNPMTLPALPTGR